jgi:hypothetical protein
MVILLLYRECRKGYRHASRIAEKERRGMTSRRTEYLRLDSIEAVVKIRSCSDVSQKSLLCSPKGAPSLSPNLPPTGGRMDEKRKTEHSQKYFMPLVNVHNGARSSVTFIESFILDSFYLIISLEYSSLDYRP